jgi:hypothetical protein
MSTNFTITRGDSVSWSVVITLDGVPFNLAGCLLWFTAKTKYTDPDVSAIFQKTIGDGITVTTPANGLATIDIVPDDTSALSEVKTVLFWDLQLKDGSDNIYTINSGNLIVNPDVTQATT